MAKKARNGGANKSQLIREYMATNPEAGPQAVAEAVKAQHGIEVTAQFVSTIKSNDKRKTGKPAGKRGPKPKSAAPATGVSHDALLAAKKFVGQMGSVASAKAAVDLLAELLK